MFVISRTLQHAEHPKITIIQDSYVALLQRWKDKRLNVWVMGGGWLAAQCLNAGLLTSIEVAVMPVVLSGGFKVLDGLARSTSLQLVDVKKLASSGIVMITYKVGAMQHDTWAIL